MSSKITKLALEATNQALLSTSLHKHGSVIVRGNKIYATGFNNNDRTCFLKSGRDTSIHSEMAALNNFVNQFARRRVTKYCFLRLP